MAVEKNDVALELLAALRTVGPYEEWLARAHGPGAAQLPALVVARRAHPERPDAEDLNRRLALATSLSQKVEHQNVVHCFGRVETDDLTAQLLEALEGVSLAQTIERSGPMPVPLALWVTRQIAEGLAHAHSLSEAHRGLNPEHVILTRNGQVKVDFGLASENPLLARSALTNFVDLRYADPRWLNRLEDHPRLDAYAIAAILWEMLTGRRYADANSSADLDYLPTERAEDGLETILERAMHRAGESFESARALGDVLTRFFYAVLDADDAADGRQALAERVVETAEPELALFESNRAAPQRGTEIRTDIDRDSFDRLVEELDQPVRPREFTQDDVDQGSNKSADGSWAPGMALKTKLATFRSEEQPTVGVPHVAPIAKAEVQPTERVDPQLLGSQPDGPTVLPLPSQSAAEKPISPPSRPVRWFLVGFVLTFTLILLYRMIGR